MERCGFKMESNDHCTVEVHICSSQSHMSRKCQETQAILRKAKLSILGVSHPYSVLSTTISSRHLPTSRRNGFGSGLLISVDDQYVVQMTASVRNKPWLPSRRLLIGNHGLALHYSTRINGGEITLCDLQRKKTSAAVLQRGMESIFILPFLACL